MSIEIIDRRRQKAEAEASAPEVIEDVAETIEKPPLRENGSWQDLCYILMPAQSQLGQHIIGRVIGLRDDGLPFNCDYMIPPFWLKPIEWEIKAKERLDTFLNCSCTNIGPCGTHQIYIRQWQEADIQRYQLIGIEPIPKSLEVMMIAEKARERLVAPAQMNPNLRKK